jgi:hypothetical protein
MKNEQYTIIWEPHWWSGEMVRCVEWPPAHIVFLIAVMDDGRFIATEISR